VNDQCWPRQLPSTMQWDHVDEGRIHEYKGQTTCCSRVSEESGREGKKKRKKERFVLTLISCCPLSPLKPVWLNNDYLQAKHQFLFLAVLHLLHWHLIIPFLCWSAPWLPCTCALTYIWHFSHIPRCFWRLTPYLWLDVSAFFGEMCQHATEKCGRYILR